MHLWYRLLSCWDLFTWERRPRERLLRRLRLILHVLTSVACIHWRANPAPDSAPVFVLVFTDAIDSLVLMPKPHPICVHLPCLIGLLQIISVGSYR